jgi:hypothetical protein
MQRLIWIAFLVGMIVRDKMCKPKRGRLDVWSRAGVHFS